MAIPYLTIAIEGADEKRVEFPEETPELVVGRSPDCQIVVAAGSVSRRHARLHCDGEKIVLEDLGSANGTTVNGKRVSGSINLNHQDRILFGAIKATFVNPPPPPPPPPPDDPGATVAIPMGSDPGATVAIPKMPEDPGATIAIPHKAAAPDPSATIAVPPPAKLATPQRKPVEAPPAPARPAAKPASLPTTRPMAPSPGPAGGNRALLELAAIGIGSYLAVVAIGWALLAFVF